jgi:RNA polymerase sigma-70 factor, ECF subfamily
MIGGGMAHSSSAEAPSSSAEAHSSGIAPGVAGDTSLMWAEFAGRLRAFVARRVPAGIEPDDVVQEVFLRVMRHLPTLRDAGRIEAWLFQIARNTLNDAMRARQRRGTRTDPLEIDPPDETETEDVRAAEAELAPCLTPMVAGLSQPYREAIELTSVHGLTQAEAAKRAGVSVSGMKSRVQRARDRLKGMLLRCCEVEVDRRRGVADFHMREPASCGTSSDASGSSSRCGAGACSQRRSGPSASGA